MAGQREHRRWQRPVVRRGAQRRTRRPLYLRPAQSASTLGWQYLRRARTEQNATEARADVLVYTTPVLAGDVEVTGEVESATLYAASSATDTDWWMKLIDVAPDGKASILTQGLARARYRQSRTKRGR